MKAIKSPSFEAMDNFADVLFQKTQKSTVEQVRTKIAKYLVDAGSKKFVELYNEVATKKDYFKALETLKIE
jgi:hypothetical protein